MGVALAVVVLLAQAPGLSDDAQHRRVLKRVEGRFGIVEVVEDQRGRELRCDGVVQTAVPARLLPQPGMLLRGRDYVELVPYFRPRARKALLVGVGGGLHAQALGAYGIEVEGVEIDPDVIALAREFFHLTIDVTIGDGRMVLSRASRRFDAIVLDAFHGDAPAARLHTREACALIADRLAPDGVAAVHLIGRPRGAFVRSAARTLGEIFPHGAAVRSGLADEIQHIWLFASRRPLDLPSAQRTKLAEYGFTGDEFFAVDTLGAELLTDERIAPLPEGTIRCKEQP